MACQPVTVRLLLRNSEPKYPRTSKQRSLARLQSALLTCISRQPFHYSEIFPGRFDMLCFIARGTNCMKQRSLRGIRGLCEGYAAVLTE